MSLARRRLRTAKQRQRNKLRAGKSTVCRDRIEKQRKIYNFMVGNDEKITGSPNSFSYSDFDGFDGVMSKYFNNLSGNGTATGRFMNQAIQLPRMSGKSVAQQSFISKMLAAIKNREDLS